MNMILNYPDYFAAAYFAAEAYSDEYISDEQIQSIKHIPMWFIHAEQDPSVNISQTTNATYKRFKTQELLSFIIVIMTKLLILVENMT